MLTSFTSNKISIAMVQISVLLLGLLVIGNWAAPSSMNELQEIYVDTCQSSCGVVNDHEETNDCREKFCPNYVSFVLTGATIPDSTPSLVSNNHKKVAEFCATWMVHLIEELGWQRRNHLNLKECNCAGGKDCVVKK